MKFPESENNPSAHALKYIATPTKLRSAPEVILPMTVGQMESRIYLIRALKVMLDSDLAALYQVPTKSLNLAVRRNLNRFPQDFMFQLNKEEAEFLRFQIATSNRRGGRRYLPYVFTEQGVAMLSSVLSSKRAIHVNIAIIRAFVKLREILSTDKDLALRLELVESTFNEHGGHITAVWSAIQKLIEPPSRPITCFGFKPDPGNHVPPRLMS